MDIMSNQVIPVDPPYPVLIGQGLLCHAGELIREILGDCRIALITDSNVASLYLETVTRSLETSGYPVSSWVIPAGEASKNMGELSLVLEFLAESGLDRTDAVIALGGGVVGDLAGFAAGCYLRGIRYVQLPTTLLAAVDSSVGGKCAVDLAEGKNLAGLFHQPSAVLCDIDCLRTLPRSILADGMAEAIKTAILSGDELFALCRRPAEPSVLREIIDRCLTFKGEVVAADPREQGLRRILNLGHTPAHAIELCSGYTVSHGQAVAMGLVIMARAGEALGWSEPGLTGKICAVLEHHQLPVRAPFQAAQLAAAALRDKKRKGTQITLVIPVRIGEWVEKTIPVTELEAVFAAGLEEFHDCSN